MTDRLPIPVPARVALLLAAMLIPAAGHLSAVATGPASTPAIDRIDPSTPRPHAAPTRLSFTGRELLPGLELDVMTPGGQTMTIGADGILDQRSTSFAAMVTLATEGNYAFKVRNTDGGVSDPFVLTVVAETPDPPAPEIAGVEPAEPRPQSQPQALRVTGRHFEPGLHAIVTDDAGRALANVNVAAVTPTEFRMTLLLDQPGMYELVISNPSGAVSNVWSLTVR